MRDTESMSINPRKGVEDAASVVDTWPYYRRKAVADEPAFSLGPIVEATTDELWVEPQYDRDTLPDAGAPRDELLTWGERMGEVAFLLRTFGPGLPPLTLRERLKLTRVAVGMLIAALRGRP